MLAKSMAKRNKEIDFSGRTKEIKTDVLVMGAGLAGIMAAIWAARSGAKVCITSSSRICSGSSFYQGTWGLGLIGPESQEDEADLVKTILEVGQGMADPELAACLVSGIQDGIEDLKAMGVDLKEATHKNEKEFIPCFDHKNRDWHGIVKESARKAFRGELARLGVTEFPDTTITDICMEQGRVTGAWAVQREGKSDTFLHIRCSSLVIAGGGLGGLFEYRLNTSDVKGMGQFLALEAGASLVNVEFMQMMPGYIKPAPKTIYNEKVFRYSRFSDSETGESIFAGWQPEKRKRCMAIRSTHGPFTCRIGSGEVDICMFEAFRKNPSGIRLTYKEELTGHEENQPEFIRTYFQWLKEEKGLTIQDSVQLGIFAHASNGGIAINCEGFTGIKGLYACGEATGGMHGADRVGGLSTANGLVFGRIAGCSAAKWNRTVRETAEDAEGRAEDRSWEAEVLSTLPDQPERMEISDAVHILEQVRKVNFRAAMVVREEKGLLDGLRQLAEIREVAKARRKPLEPGPDAGKRYREARELEGGLVLSEVLLKAALQRKESRGSHYREDFPAMDEAYSKPIKSVWNNEKIFLS